MGWTSEGKGCEAAMNSLDGISTLGGYGRKTIWMLNYVMSSSSNIPFELLNHELLLRDDGLDHVTNGDYPYQLVVFEYG
jgi:hypothetical protein